MSRLAVFLFLGASLSLAHAQTTTQRLRPGQLFEPDEKVFIPRYGLTSVIPVHWEGVLPRGTEVFRLLSTEEDNASILVFVKQHEDFGSLADQWISGYNLDRGVQITSRKEPEQVDDMIMVEVTGEGQHVTRWNRGFAAAVCNSRGLCVISFLSTSTLHFEKGKRAVIDFMNRIEFQIPSGEATYATFDWREFLPGKALITMSSYETGGRESKIHFCGDGSVLSDLKNERLFGHQQEIHKGRRPGMWSAAGVGEESVVQIRFKRKLDPVEFRIRIRDERIFVDDIPVYFLESDWCK